MPIHDTNCSGFVWGVVDDDGNVSQTYRGIPAAKVIAESRFIPEIARFDHCRDEISITMKLHIRNRRGLIDILTGMHTPAAGRYIRNTKRWKEKQRRKKLKGGMIHGAD